MTSPASRVAKTTCYMCACRCGIDVHIEAGRVKHIEGNRDHPVNKGVLCAKGAAGLMQHLSPARLRAPLRRTGPRGTGEFKEITWNEALGIATNWLAPVREKHPERLAFFTGRDQSQSFTGWWAQQYGTPNYAAHGGFCSVNMAAAGIYTLGGAFWEFGSPDWERTKLLLLFGVAEDHDSNPIKIGLGKLKSRGVPIVSINPVRTGYSAIADQWLGITPGTDGLLVLSLIHCLLRAGRIDLPYLLAFTNVAWLVDQGPRSPTFGQFLRDAAGTELVWDPARHKPVPWTGDARPALTGTFNTGPTHAKPVFQLITEAYLDPALAPEAVAPACGLDAADIHRLAALLAHTAFDEAITLDRPWTDFRGNRHETMIGRPVAFHAMRGISAHANGFQTCRAIHLLQTLLGAVETPGSFRFKPPYPKPVSVHPKPHHKVTPGKPLDGPHLGYPRGPEDLAIDADGRARRIDKAFSWDAPLAAHGMMHMVIANAVAGDPVPDRGALPLHGQHGLELGDEHRRHHGDADRHRRLRRVPDPEDHRRRRLCLGDDRLRRPDPPGHHLPRAARLPEPPRPADLRARRRPGRDPLAGGRPRPRRPPVPVGDARPRRPARPPRHGRARRHPRLRRLRRLPHPPPAPPRRRAARRLARRRRRPGPRRPQSGPARPLHRERRLLAGARPGGGRLLQAVEPPPTRTGPSPSA